MKVSEVIANEFLVRYDGPGERLLIYTLKNGEPDSDVPISLRMETLIEMGADEAAKWVGQTLLLLIPETREVLFKLPAES